VKHMLVGGIAVVVLSGLMCPGEVLSREIALEVQSRDPQTDVVSHKEVVIETTKTAFIIVDMWDAHWCMTCSQRAVSLVPRLNAVVDVARKLGVTVIWNPTDAIGAYAGTRMYQKGLVPEMNAPRTRNLAVKFTAPFAPSGYCVCGKGIQCLCHYIWTGQNPDLVLDDEYDYMAAASSQIYSILKKRDIEHVIYLGIATNVCLYTKPGGIKAIWGAGYDCLFTRDVTDAITVYDPEKNYNLDIGTATSIADLERGGIPSINIKETFQELGLLEKELKTDYVLMAPWGKASRPYLFRDDFILTLSYPEDADCKIYYTTDGTAPTVNSLRYSSPLRIDSTSTINAAAFKDGCRVSLVSDGVYVKMPGEAPLPTVYLDSLDYEVDTFTHLHPAFKKSVWYPRKGLAFDGKPLNIRVKVYEKGLGFRAPSAIYYPIKPTYKRFVAKAGIDYNVFYEDRNNGRRLAPKCSVVFRVFIDGALMAESPVMLFGQEPWSFDVAIPAGSKNISLACTDAGTHSLIDYGNWVEAGFVE